MGKTTFKPGPDLKNRLLSAFGPAFVAEIDPTRDFLTVGTPRDARPEQIQTLDNKPQ